MNDEPEPWKSVLDSEPIPPITEEMLIEAMDKFEVDSSAFWWEFY